MADTKMVKAAESQPAETEPRSIADFFADFGRFRTPFRTFGNLLGYDPFALMSDLRKEMKRFLPADGEMEAFWSPEIDVKQAKGALVVKVDLPGLKKEEIKLAVTNRALTLEGERTREEKEEKKDFYRSERTYGHFYRSIPLPEGAKTDQVKADLKDGVLEVTIPVPETTEYHREVPINSGTEVKTAA